MTTRAWLLALAAMAGCGYRVGGLHAVREVRLRIFDAQPERRTHEFELTDAVARELQRRGIRVNAAGATHELTGEIEAFDQPAVVVDASDVPLVGAVAIRIRIRLVEAASGAVVVEESRTESAGFSGARGESVETARQEAFERLARWVATKFESDW